MSSLLTLTLRTELMDVIIITFLWYSVIANKDEKLSAPFKRILSVVTALVFFDVIVVCSLAFFDNLSQSFTELMSAVYALTMFMSAGEIYHYVVYLIEPDVAARRHRMIIILMGVYVLLQPLIGFEFPYVGIMHTVSGIAMFYCEIMAFIFGILIYYEVYKNKSRLSKTTVHTIIVATSTCVAFGIIEIAVPLLQFVGSSFAFGLALLYFRIEQPMHSFTQGAVASIYEKTVTVREMKKIIREANVEYEDHRTGRYIILCCRLMDFPNICENEGSIIGEKYMALVISSLNAECLNASHICRYRNSKILLFYKDVEESIVVNELNDAKINIASLSPDLGFEPQVAINYDVSGDGFESLDDMVKHQLTLKNTNGGGIN